MKKILWYPLAAVLLLVSSSVGQTTQWMDPAWQYRNQVIIGNSNAQSLSQFEVNVQLNASFDFSKAQPDGADIRITGNDGVTAVPFWVESWQPSTGTASIWARLPNIPTTGTTAYLYYGNPSAKSASSGDATFEFFDDFEKGTSPEYG